MIDRLSPQDPNFISPRAINPTIGGTFVDGHFVRASVGRLEELNAIAVQLPGCIVDFTAGIAVCNKNTELERLPTQGTVIYAQPADLFEKAVGAEMPPLPEFAPLTDGFQSDAPDSDFVQAEAQEETTRDVEAHMIIQPQTLQDRREANQRIYNGINMRRHNLSNGSDRNARNGRSRR